MTPAQLQTLKTNLAANTNTVQINGVATAINAVPQGAQNAQSIADWYNLTAAPAYQVIRTDAAVEGIHNAISYAKFTPNPAVNSTNAAQGAQAALYAQTKLMNLDKLIGRPSQTTFNATLATNAKSLNDAVTNLPTGASFALLDAGWANVLPVLNRACTNGEKLFVTANATVTILNDGVSARGTTGNPDLMTFEGKLAGADISSAWAA